MAVLPVSNAWWWGLLVALVEKPIGEMPTITSDTCILHFELGMGYPLKNFTTEMYVEMYLYDILCCF